MLLFTCSASLSLTQNIILLYRITYIFIVENQLTQFTFRISFLLINLISLLLQTLLQSILAASHFYVQVYNYILLVDKLRSCFGLLLTIYLRLIFILNLAKMFACESIMQKVHPYILQLCMLCKKSI